MAQLLAPYNSAMRLGQGFNSYTQQICINDAVSIDPNWKPEVQRSEAIIVGFAKQDSKEAAEDSEPEAYEELNRFEKESRIRSEPAVRKSSGARKKDVVKGNFNYQAGEALSVLPWVKPQIVTYTSKFVDKLSDVTDSMNISGSLSIQTSQIGGKANGSYLDSDKFKASDINFLLQVKVTNQILKPPEYTQFNKNSGVDASEFREVYGDCFISGWEEGGEMNAVISVKVLDKSNISKIKAALEAQLTTPSLSGKISANVDLEKSTVSQETETTITVNWSGGGSIKDPMVDWSIGTLKQAAAAFPELVAITPQRTYAVLTKYTALSSFHSRGYKYSPLQYENAGLYTNALLDAFMDYKSMWKQISQATDALESGQASIELGRPSEEIYAQAVIKVMSQDETDRRLIESRKQKLLESELATAKAEVKKLKAQSSGTEKAIEDVDTPPTNETAPEQTAADDASAEKTKTEDKKDVIPYTVFKDSFVGLIQARRACRFEMSKIVNEVGLVAKDPGIATDTRRDDYFLNPLVFKQLLPVVRSLTPENAKMGIKDPNAAILLGYCAPDQGDHTKTPLFDFTYPFTDLPGDLQISIKKNEYKADGYRMEGISGPVKDIGDKPELIDALKQLDPTYRPTSIGVWTHALLQHLVGIRMKYSNGQSIDFGACSGNALQEIHLERDGSEYITQVTIQTSRSENGKVEIFGIELCTSNCKFLSSSVPLKEGAFGDAEEAKETKEAKTGPSSGEGTTHKQDEILKKPTKMETRSFSWYKKGGVNWSLRGFFCHKLDKGLLNLGVIWGKDGFVPVPTGAPRMPLAKDFLCQSPVQKKKIDLITRTTPQILGKFLMGDVLVTGPIPKNGTTEAFNALEEIDTTWKIKSLGFAASNRKLTGIQVIYLDGTELIHGHYTENTRVWKCDTKAPFISTKISAARLPTDAMTYVTSVEFVKGDSAGRTPDWIFDVSTFRYLGEGEEGLMDTTSMIESAPTIGKAIWTVRGFYGEYSATQITRLGVIWGRG
ncbi:hypothetical protein H072_8001 [Dactylellina haptotyla CBS 200.50]|uniref:Uncharacterized protein n=1 Tax=Dactylellina haptotyla (strain CBS 200.50) TaxID=1284197 RepID=S8A6B6_DACHA|nr:hypothetical protein H072_8001 [Dactylellina haptotyla CBS 200.50]